MKKFLALLTLSTLSFSAQANTIVVSIAPFQPEADIIFQSCKPASTTQQTDLQKAQMMSCLQNGLVTIQTTLSNQLKDNIIFQTGRLIPAQKQYADLLAQLPPPQIGTQIGTPMPPSPYLDLNRQISAAKTNLNKARGDFKRLLNLVSQIRADEAKMIQFINYLSY